MYIHVPNYMRIQVEFWGKKVYFPTIRSTSNFIMYFKLNGDRLISANELGTTKCLVSPLATRNRSQLVNPGR